jgi:DNA-binding NtrC family response regulator
MEDKMSQQNSQLSAKSPLPQENSSNLADRFKQKTLELAREGYLGSLKTKKSQLQSAYANLLHLIDQTHVPILIYGEAGSGKRRLIDEYFILHNFYRRLDNLKQGQLRVYKSNFLQNGWQELFTPAHNSSADFIYLENVDELSPERQNELLALLRFRKGQAKTLLELPRIVLGTEKALSLLVMQGRFSRDLFHEITSFAVFLPSLQERSEDVLDIVQSFSYEISGRTQQPPTWFVDFVSHQMWSRNLDELKLLMKNLFLKNREMRSWQYEDLPVLYTGAHASSSFQSVDAPDVTEEVTERARIVRALQRFQGDRNKAAIALGLGRADFLQKLLEYRIR